MIRTIIVDDEQASIDTLQAILKRLRTDIKILGTANDADSGLKLVREHENGLDLLLLDIQMEPDRDGFYLLEQLEDIRFKVVFITAYDSYALKAIKFAALDYILKPVDPLEMAEALQAFDKSRETNLPAEFKKALALKSYFDKVAIPTMTDVRFIPVNSILYLESEKNYTTLCLDNKQKIVSSRNIGFFEELLEPQFFRCHNSYLVNMAKVTRFVRGKTGMIELDNDIKLEVSTRRKNELLERLGL